MLMRLWSINPKYLDSKGLVALWRESLLAKAVLTGQTKGYKHHPQLNRFYDSSDPIYAINFYLQFIYYEAQKRHYTFSSDKFLHQKDVPKFTLEITTGQLEYEKSHLIEKLMIRDPSRIKLIQKSKLPEPHPLFTVIKGEIAPWENIQHKDKQF